MSASPHGPLRVGVGGPVGSGKTALVDALCKRLRDRYELAVITNDIYTREDAEFLTRSGALAPERIAGVETGGCPHTAIREDASINLAAIERMRQAFPRLDLVFIEFGRRQSRRHVQPRARGPHDLRHRRRRRRQDPKEGRSGHHPLGPAGDQQDRSGAPGRRRSRRHGARRPAHARRASVRLRQHSRRRRRRARSPISSGRPAGWVRRPHEPREPAAGGAGLLGEGRFDARQHAGFCELTDVNTMAAGARPSRAIPTTLSRRICTVWRRSGVGKEDREPG